MDMAKCRYLVGTGDYFLEGGTLKMFAHKSIQVMPYKLHSQRKKKCLPLTPDARCQIRIGACLL